MRDRLRSYRILIEVPLWSSAVVAGLAGASTLRAKGWDPFSWQGILLALIMVVFLVGLIMTPLLVLKQVLADYEGDYPQLTLTSEQGHRMGYLYLREIGPGEATRQVSWEEMIFDFNDKDELLGIEFLNADKHLGAPRKED